jgi:hypothetical protein
LLVDAARRGNERGLYAGPLTLSSPKMRFSHFFFTGPESRPISVIGIPVKAPETRQKTTFAADLKSNLSITHSVGMA